MEMDFRQGFGSAAEAAAPGLETPVAADPFETFTKQTRNACGVLAVGPNQGVISYYPRLFP
jgi:hypothetical protein